MNRLASLTLAAAGAALAACPPPPSSPRPKTPSSTARARCSSRASTSAASAPWPTAACPTTPRPRSPTPRWWPRFRKLPWAGFGPGTEGGKAKPEIWNEQAKFKEHSDKLMAETGKLLAAAKTGNLDTLKAAVASVGGTCKACHDTFRKD